MKIMEINLLEDVSFVRFFRLILIGFIHNDGALGIWLGFWRFETQFTIAYRIPNFKLEEGYYDNEIKEKLRNAKQKVKA